MTRTSFGIISRSLRIIRPFVREMKKTIVEEAWPAVK
jgi:hypothetical protein